MSLFALIGIFRSAGSDIVSEELHIVENHVETLQAALKRCRQQVSECLRSKSSQSDLDRRKVGNFEKIVWLELELIDFIEKVAWIRHDAMSSRWIAKSEGVQFEQRCWVSGF